MGRAKGSGNLFTDEIANRICGLLRGGMTLRECCRRPEITVAASTVLGWRDDTSQMVTTEQGQKLLFGEQYARAREDGYFSRFEEMLQISKDCLPINGEVQKARLQIDTLKWMLSRAMPRLYGDSVSLLHAGYDGGPIKQQSIEPRDLARSILDVLAEAGESSVELELLEAPETKH